jgi:uncharacterized protein involved in cysteine biosynthesis
MLGFSCGVMALLAIPFLQLFCIPLAVIGATRLWCEEEGLLKYGHNEDLVTAHEKD